MELVRTGKPIVIRMRKDLLRSIKRGHVWLYSNAIEIVDAPSGSVGILQDRKGERIASGIYDPRHAIPLRICRTDRQLSLDDAWLTQRLYQAWELRKNFFDPIFTDGFRMVAGEGDGVPGLVIDVYGKSAVIKLDGGAPEQFYKTQGIANWLAENCGITTVVQRFRDQNMGSLELLGTVGSSKVSFLENGLQFQADILRGQKTGFFLDQRDNRHLIRQLSNARRVLNLFSYNGGFSIAAGTGGAKHVTSVDLAPLAIESAQEIWEVNGLPPKWHDGVVTDCFEFLESAIRSKQSWDIVICDPPSFAPSESTRPQALAAYGRLAGLAARVTTPGGFLALASCSSHIDMHAFSEANENEIGRARRKAMLFAERGLPLDHPTPLAMPELRYLKFQLFQLA